MLKRYNNFMKDLAVACIVGSLIGFTSLDIFSQKFKLFIILLSLNIGLYALLIDFKNS